MRHGMNHRKLGRNPGHRKALLRNMMNSLVRSERVETTVAKAKELRPLADRLITLGKRNTLHARRRVFSILSDKANTEKLFSGLAGRFTERAGGYTRIVRTGYRAGDGSEMAIIEYLPPEEKKTEAKKGRKRKTTSKAPVAAKKKAAKETPEKKEKTKTTRKTSARKKPTGDTGTAKTGKAATEKPATKPRGKKKSSAKEAE